MMVQSRAASGQFATKSSRSAAVTTAGSHHGSHGQHAIGEEVRVASRLNHVNANPTFFQPHAKAHSSVATHHHERGDGPPPKRRKLSIRTTNTNTNTSTHSGKHTQTTLDAFAFAQPKPPNQLIRHEPRGQIAETINGVKSTLNVRDDELLPPSPRPELRRTRSPQPAPPATISTPTPQKPVKKDDKRTLRSADDGPRLKSELAVYFPNYEDIIFDAPQEEEFLNADTTLYVTDDTAKPETVSPAKSSNNAANGRRVSVNGTAGTPSTPQRSLSNQFNGSSSVNLDFVAKNIPDDPEDPLTDEHFLKSHKRAERKEKQLRNIEKERAMHEKVQLDKLLDGLRGHDWLRVLGITGVTESEARKYEKKRDYFISEVEALLDKFKQWRDQEKKQRATKEAAVAAREVEEEEGDSTEGSVEPPSSDLNASAARQLQQETIIALKKSSSMASLKSKGKERGATSHPSQPATPTTAPPRLAPPPPPAEPPSPITSFYAKRHLRDAALSKTRHGRSITAFGHPVPEMQEKDFELPDDYVSEDVLRANARERRRRKRESAINAKEKDGS
ncbi:hypothetical protein CLAFUW4_08209 [Fulvia fulva]|uniref:Something about silencing protein 4 domain-containing protein n=1 Tax=Passalora fulva TaxID=5499 RepID=A0A9Q8LDJ1_PASFU|nr:uncharacterized protein CLAFUR5_08321 [Fulvia fulva]KAK4629402.1 hypothetical protein CLAFUR4_08214 [Fulvia fulva]KAK4630600.1 hypothetical protein CLAFUR0_08209 [Fulvia fulva]UJO15438.1 hypothetical protein CLAFUR5_08321 [Fulvia fulva]WPV12315.1 hypothetical protein CLAFUW4_08209 [Fulvia fulva]WPV27120.1 hypothetical protein CLAFUW7_08209 [Fulvia fulva]